MTELYEIHLSVQADNVNEFINVCKWLEVKPIVIDLQDDRGQHQMRDVMTSTRFATDDIRDVYTRAFCLKNELWDLGYPVVREKFETMITNPLVPTNGILPEGQYFEAHIALKGTEDKLKFLGLFARHWGLHLSRNPFKISSDGTRTQMMTRRAYRGDADDFASYIKAVTDDLCISEREGMKVEMEYVFFDSNTAHDGSWGIAA